MRSASSLRVIARRTVQPLARERLTLSNDLFADLVPNRECGTLGRSSTALDAGAALGARPLSVRLLGADCQRHAASLRQRDREQATCSTPRSTSASPRRSIGCWRASSNGSFGLWSSGGDDVWLDAYE
jgi:hypothetical protein